MYFKFTAADCNEPERRELGEDRFLKHKSGGGGGGSGSGIFTCTDECDGVDDTAEVIITDKKDEEVYYSGTVSVDDTITIAPSSGKVDSTINIKIFNADGAIAQIISLHSSCSKPIFTGDVFGALTLTGWTNSDQGRVGQ